MLLLLQNNMPTMKAYWCHQLYDKQNVQLVILPFKKINMHAKMIEL